MGRGRSRGPVAPPCRTRGGRVAAVVPPPTLRARAGRGGGGAAATPAAVAAAVPRRHRGGAVLSSAAPTAARTSAANTGMAPSAPASGAAATAAVAAATATLRRSRGRRWGRLPSGGPTDKHQRGAAATSSQIALISHQRIHIPLGPSSRHYQQSRSSHVALATERERAQPLRNVGGRKRAAHQRKTSKVVVSSALDDVNRNG